MKRQIIFSILLIVGLQGCTLGTTVTTVNENISDNVTEEINKLDAKVIKAITNSDVESFKLLMSDAFLKKNGKQLNQLIPKLSSMIKTTDYKTVNQFYTKDSTPGLENTVMTGIDGIDDYVIKYQALNNEMFVSLVVPDIGTDEYLITNIYGKYPEGWRLNMLLFSQYSVNGKTAPQLYKQALQEYDKGYLVDAVNSMFLSSKIGYPANEIWKYQKEDEMRGFAEKILAEMNEKHNFPVSFAEIASKPQIFNIYSLGTEIEYFPAVEYVTTIDFDDTAKLEMENDKIHEIIGNKFKGIDKDKKYIFYKAYSEMPDGEKGVPTYGFRKENK